MQTPMVQAFLTRCREKQLTNDQLFTAIKTACARFPEIADEFEDAGLIKRADWRDIGRVALRVGGGLVGGIGGGLGGAVGGAALGTLAGLPAGPAALGTGGYGGLAGGVLGTAAGGYAGEEAGKHLGNLLLGAPKEPAEEQPAVKTAGLPGTSWLDKETWPTDAAPPTPTPPKAPVAKPAAPAVRGRLGRAGLAGAAAVGAAGLGYGAYRLGKKLLGSEKAARSLLPVLGAGFGATLGSLPGGEGATRGALTGLGAGLGGVAGSKVVGRVHKHIKPIHHDYLGHARLLGAGAGAMTGAAIGRDIGKELPLKKMSMAKEALPGGHLLGRGIKTVASWLPKAFQGTRSFLTRGGAKLQAPARNAALTAGNREAGVQQTVNRLTRLNNIDPNHAAQMAESVAAGAEKAVAGSPGLKFQDAIGQQRQQLMGQLSGTHGLGGAATPGQVGQTWTDARPAAPSSWTQGLGGQAALMGGLMAVPMGLDMAAGAMRGSPQPHGMEVQASVKEAIGASGVGRTAAKSRGKFRLSERFSSGPPPKSPPRTGGRPPEPPVYHGGGDGGGGPDRRYSVALPWQLQAGLGAVDVGARTALGAGADEDNRWRGAGRGALGGALHSGAVLGGMNLGRVGGYRLGSRLASGREVDPELARILGGGAGQLGGLGAGHFGTVGTANDLLVPPEWPWYKRLAKTKPPARQAVEHAFKRADFQRLLGQATDHWETLSPQHKMMAVGGGAAGLAGLVNQLRPRGEGDSTPTLMNAGLGLGGLGTAAYGLSGGHPERILPAVRGLFGGGAVPAGNATTPSPGGGLQKYLGSDGSPDFRALVNAPDAELQTAAKQLTPAQREQFRAKLLAFKPSLGQRMGAAATGVNIEGQRERFKGLLG